MSTENPFERKTSAQEVDTSYVDIAEGKLGAEISPADIESAESRMDASAARLKETMAKPTNEKKIENPDTWEKIQDAWSNAKGNVALAFSGFMGLNLGAMIWTDKTYQAGQAALQSGVDYAELSERLAQLQTADSALLLATAAVPLIMLGMSKLSKMRREKNLTNPTTATA